MDASHAEKSSTSDIEGPPEPDSATIKRLTISRDWLGHKIDGAGTRIDNFFMQRVFGDNIIHGDFPAKNKAKLFFETGPIERRGIRTKVGLDVRLALPNTKKRLKFIASSNNDDENSNNEIVASDGQEKDSFVTGFQYMAKKVSHWKPSLKLGAKWGQSPEIFVEGRVRRLFGKPEHNVSVSHSSTYYSKRHLINTVRANYFKKFTDNWGLSLTNQVRHFNDDRYYAFNHVLGLQHRINERNALVHQIAANGDDQQHPFVDSYTASFRWRRRIHSSWLFFEVVPSHTYFVRPSLTQSPDSEAALLFRLEALINNN